VTVRQGACPVLSCLQPTEPFASCTPQIRWLERLINSPDAQAALALVPESLPKDAASWLTFCVQCGRAGGWAGRDPAVLYASLA
jgi:hypothetical protein